LEETNMIFEAIAELIADRSDVDVAEVTMESRFQDFGIDSLDTVEMLFDLEDKLSEKLGKSVEVELDQKVETVGDLVAFIEGKIGE